MQNKISFITDYLVGMDTSHRTKIINDSIDQLKNFRKDFDVIVFCGMSGAIIAPIIAHKLKKHLTFVRKRGSTHSNYNVEGYVGGNYIIVDDFIESGKTIRFIKNSMDKFYKEFSFESHSKPLNLVGVHLYAKITKEDFNQYRTILNKKKIDPELITSNQYISRRL